VFKNPENAGMARKIYYQVKSYLVNLHEMFKNLGSRLVPGIQLTMSNTDSGTPLLPISSLFLGCMNADSG
jgi:hypothetical protein